MLQLQRVVQQTNQISINDKINKAQKVNQLYVKYYNSIKCFNMPCGFLYNNMSICLCIEVEMLLQSV